MTKFFQSFLAMMIVGFIQVGLALLGWGIDDFAGFVSHPARMILLVVLGITSVVFAWFMPKNSFSDGTKDKLVMKQKIPVFLIGTAFISMSLLEPYCDRRDLWLLASGDTVRYVGLAIFLVGAIFCSWGPLYLGKQFSWNVTVQEDHQLVTGGPFSLMRHPRYFGIITWSLGAALIYRSLIGAILTVFVCAMLMWRIADEEILMRQEFGQQWEQYCKRTKRLIPLVY